MRTDTALALLLLSAVALLSTTQEAVHAQGRRKGGDDGCAITSVTPVAFGNYDTDAAVRQTSTGTLQFRCHSLRTITVRVSIGPSGVSGSIAQRRMRELGGDDELQYNLFHDPRGSAVWGDGIHGGSPAFVTGRRDFRVEIYGIVPAQQQVSEGIYADVLRISVQP